MSLSDKIIKLLIGVGALVVVVYLVLFSIGTYLNWKDYKGQQVIVPVGGRILFSSILRDPKNVTFLLQDGKIQPLSQGGMAKFIGNDKYICFWESGFKIFDSKGLGIRQIMLPPNYSPFDFDISPDGKTIVFSSRMGKDGMDYNLYTIDIDGKDLKKLTDFTPVGDSHVGSPAFSPDGKKIAFAARKHPGDSKSPVGIYIMNVDGSGQREVLGDKIENGEEPAWSPDGKSIAFVSFVKTEGVFKNLFTIELGKGDLKQITNFNPRNYGHANNPCYSPDGKQICFALETRGITAGQEIFAINTDGTNLIRLTPAKRVSQYPGWATDKYPDWGK